MSFSLVISFVLFLLLKGIGIAAVVEDGNGTTTSIFDPIQRVQAMSPYFILYRSMKQQPSLEELQRIEVFTDNFAREVLIEQVMGVVHAETMIISRKSHHHGHDQEGGWFMKDSESNKDSRTDTEILWYGIEFNTTAYYVESLDEDNASITQPKLEAHLTDRFWMAWNSPNATTNQRYLEDMRLFLQVQTITKDGVVDSWEKDRPIEQNPFWHVTEVQLATSAGLSPGEANSNGDDDEQGFWYLVVVVVIFFAGILLIIGFIRYGLPLAQKYLVRRSWGVNKTLDGLVTESETMTPTAHSDAYPSRNIPTRGRGLIQSERFIHNDKKDWKDSSNGDAQFLDDVTAATSGHVENENSILRIMDEDDDDDLKHEDKDVFEVGAIV